MEYENFSKKELIVRLKKLESEKLQIWDNTKNLITKISHEMKTPLNSIIGFSELFRYKIPDAKLSNYADNIRTSSEYLLSLVQNLIDVTISQQKPIELAYSIFNSKDTILEVIKDFSDKNICTTLIDITICADYTRFKQLVINLTSNAIKYNRNNNPIIIMTYLDGKNFCFEITDNGDGIAKKDQKRIFQLFTQVSKDINKRQTGSGIGLALCKTIVDAHKGSIDVKSSIGKGATFIFKLPIDKV